MIWLIGVGNMGQEYAKVLNALKVPFIAIGRGEKAANKFETHYEKQVIRGGLEAFLEKDPCIPDAAIVAVNVEYLANVTKTLLAYNVRHILVEKPGFTEESELIELLALAKAKNADIFIAYNRRFYSSILRAEEIIRQDGGVVCMSFEFTEWIHTIDSKNYSEIALNRWILSNSSHVIDTAFFLGGKPEYIQSYVTGRDIIDWHATGCNYVGAGKSDKGALFTYLAAWDSPGRWALEILTPIHRLYFRPMEILQIQNKGSVAISPVEINDNLDSNFKPGFYRQISAFLEGDYSRLCSLEEQLQSWQQFYKKISFY